MSGDRLDADLKVVDDCDAPELLAIWRRHLTDSAPDHLPKSLLARLLAYRLQIERHGGLSKKAASYLKVIRGQLQAGRVPETPHAGQKQLKPGSQLIREHDGILHRVMVLEGSYAWDGKTFPSLSAVARAITGTNWNGNRFFGLQEKSKTRAEVTA